MKTRFTLVLLAAALTTATAQAQTAAQQEQEQTQAQAQQEKALPPEELSAEQSADAAKHAQWAAEAEQAKVRQQAQTPAPSAWEQAKDELEHREHALEAEDLQARENLDLDLPVFIKPGAIVCYEEDHMAVLLNHMMISGNPAAVAGGAAPIVLAGFIPPGFNLSAEMNSYGCVNAAPNQRVAVILMADTKLGLTEVLFPSHRQSVANISHRWVRYSSLTNTVQQPAPSHTATTDSITDTITDTENRPLLLLSLGLFFLAAVFVTYGWATRTEPS